MTVQPQQSNTGETAPTHAPEQPWMHDMRALVSAPAQFWSNPDGSVDGRSLCGFYVADTRMISAIIPVLAGEIPTPVSWSASGSDTSSTSFLVRAGDFDGVDPRVRLRVDRSIGHGGMRDRLVVENGLDRDLDLKLQVGVTLDMAAMQEIKGGVPSFAATNHLIDIRATEESVYAAYRGTRLQVTAQDAEIEVDDNTVWLSWPIRVPAEGQTAKCWEAAATSSVEAVVAAPDRRPWGDVDIDAVRDIRLKRWVGRSLDDLGGLRMTIPAMPQDQFLAAGAPWFFTLFGRDSLWAARFMLPLGTGLAGGTLRTLAHFQATGTDLAIDADPGKIMHELRAETLKSEGAFAAHGMQLPPLYYGTTDATELWIILLGEAMRWGMPDREVEPMLDNLEAALNWMMRWGDADADGFLEYVDRTGHGLSNQGWKDSGDSVRWRNGALAKGPIALCEVQGYAYQAAVLGAEILERFNRPGASHARDWAGRLKRLFNERFWVRDETGRYPAIALDVDKQPVDSLTSNIGHLLGTGILDREGVSDVVSRLMGPELLSGYGIRTLSCDSGGYSPLSYHCGSVWMHDSAIAMLGMAAEGYRHEALTVAEELLRAAELFGYQTPELYSGDGPDAVAIPYPAACHPQAWSAASSIAVLATMMDMRPICKNNGETAILLEPQQADAQQHIRISGRDIEYR